MDSLLSTNEWNETSHDQLGQIIVNYDKNANRIFAFKRHLSTLTYEQLRKQLSVFDRVESD